MVLHLFLVGWLATWLASNFIHSLPTDVCGFGLPPSFFGLFPIPCLGPLLLDVWPLSGHPELRSPDSALP